MTYLEAYPNWRIYSVLEYDRITVDLILIRNMVYFIAMVVFVISVFIIHKVTERITDPVLELNRAMDIFQNGEWPQPLVPKTDDELRSLVLNFNQMVDRFKVVLEQVMTEQEEKKKAEIEALEVKMMLLESQINPHFVHNTLNAIQYLAKEEGALEVREMIQSFNLLLRTSMSVGKDFVTIAEELECVQSFLKIQTLRYGNIFDFKINVGESILNERIPKLILQPIVENALYHGIVPKNTHGTIDLSMIQADGFIHIEIRDDGIGMDQVRLKEIFSEKNEHEEWGYNNIGLANINMRLNLYYGSDYRLCANSIEHEGTTINFKIPYDEIEVKHV